MEAFEHVVKVYLETKGYVVSSGVKFPIKRRIEKKSGRIEFQTHGFEVDLVAARCNELKLVSVKSYFGSRGVNRQGFPTIADRAKRCHFKRYTMFNDEQVKDGILTGAATFYGYPRDQVLMALYVGKFCVADEELVRKHLTTTLIGGGPVEVVGLRDLVDSLRLIADQKTYLNDPVIMTLKMARIAGMFNAKKVRAVEDLIGDSSGNDDEDEDDEEDC